MEAAELEDFDAFAHLVTALRPWLGQLVVVGGWAHRLHRFHPLAQAPDHLPLRTRDADLAFSTDAALAGDLPTALKDAGFTEELFGDDAPAPTHYRLGDEDAGFYAEFLTSLHGSGVKRDGTPDATVSKGGVTMPATTARRVEVIARNLFAQVTDTIREAARIPQDRRLAPENVQRACEYGLGEILANEPTS